MKQLLMEGDTPFLPQEIIASILKQLPVKSIIRFQCVCKLWKNIIKTPSFISDHLHHSSAQSPSLLFQGYGEGFSLNLYLLDHEMNVREVPNAPKFDPSPYAKNGIISSSNGLLCIEMGKYGIGEPPPSLLLCNPAIGEIRQVPARTINNFRGDCFFGFGFSPIVNDYKIVRIYAELGVLVSQVVVYSLSTGLWKEIEIGDDLEGLQLSSETVTANGVIFWSAIEPGAKEEGEDDIDGDFEVMVFDIDMIVSFDMASEEFACIQKPAIYDSNTKLTLYENKLAILSHTVIGKRESSLIDLWVMEEGPSACGERWIWTQKHAISTSLSIGVLCPFSIWRNDIVCNVEVMIPRFIAETQCAENIRPVTALSLGNLSTFKLKEFIIGRCGDRYSRIFNHVESLVPVATSTLNNLDPKS